MAVQMGVQLPVRVSAGWAQPYRIVPISRYRYVRTV